MGQEQRPEHRSQDRAAVFERGVISDGRRVLRLQGSAPDAYGFLVTCQDSEIIPVNNSQETVDSVNAFLQNLSLEPIQQLPQWYLVIAHPNGKDGQRVFQVIDPASAIQRKNLAASKRDDVPQVSPNGDHSNSNHRVLLEGSLYLIDQDGHLSVVDAVSGEKYTSHYRRCSALAMTADELSKTIPQLGEISDRKWREMYAKEIYRRILEQSFPRDAAQRSLTATGLSSRDSQMLSLTLADWRSALVAKSPAGYWSMQLTEVKARIRPQQVAELKDFPPHMGISSPEDKLQYLAAVNVSQAQEKIYRQLARYRKSQSGGVDGVAVGPEEIREVEETVTVEEIDAYLATLKKATDVSPTEKRIYPPLRAARERIVVRKDECDMVLDKAVAENQAAVLGEVSPRADIKSTIGQFLTLPEYRTQYPEVVIMALGNLYKEYNGAFGPLVVANREWSTDYQYCMAADGTPVNYFVQIDMVGLPDQFLNKANGFSEEQVRGALRGRIFEIENSLAMYQLLERMFSQNGQDTLFKRQFRASLDDLRRTHGRPIALLAVTEQKYNAMRESEFGKTTGEPLTDNEVMELSGFDRFFGPEEFERYLRENGGDCGYLLYARTSDPVAKLRKPDIKVEIPLLEDESMRRIIKAHAVTFNVDCPGWTPADPRRINDTKAYLIPMGMAAPVYAYTDVESPGFDAYLKSQGIAPEQIASREVPLRAKPMKGTYGCYGHLVLDLNRKFDREELKRNLHKRGPYVLQPEMKIPVIVNETDGRVYTYIDRNFLAFANGHPKFLGGFRSLMPLESTEAKNGRNHGSSFTVWAEIS